MNAPRNTAAPAGRALLWSQLHAPLVLVIFHAPLARGLAEAPGWTAAVLSGGYVAEALFLTLLPFLLALPTLPLPRVFHWAAPVTVAMLTAFCWVDAQVQQTLGFHINALVWQVAMQPNAFRGAGIPLADVLQALGLTGALAAMDLTLGTLFLRRGLGWRWWPAVVAATVLLECGDRVAVAVLEFHGGLAFQSAGHALPLQPPVRMKKLLQRLTGAQPALGGLHAGGTAIPDSGPAPQELHFTRTPDVVLLLAESLRGDFLDQETMPRLSERALHGAVYDRHYSSASSTHFALFSIFYGMHAQRRDAVVGAGRTPLLFRALRSHGYQLKVVTSSTVNCMGMRQTVFKELSAQELEMDPPGEIPDRRDAAMVASAENFVASADPGRPIFLFLFFDATHFNYSYPPDAERFTPCWDGQGVLDAKDRDPALLRNRSRNAAWEVDRKLDTLLSTITRARGRAPTVFFTGDHGEAFGEHGQLGHASGVFEEQVHVPMVVLDETLKPGHRDAVTGHADVLPTIFHLLGDRHPAELYSDGIAMELADTHRFTLSTMGWDPRSAVIGHDLKVSFVDEDAGLGGITLTDPRDQPLADAQAKFQQAAPLILKALGKPR